MWSEKKNIWQEFRANNILEKKSFERKKKNNFIRININY